MKEKIKELLQGGDFNQIQSALKKKPDDLFAEGITPEALEKQYDVKKHSVFDTSVRKKKEVKRPTGEFDSEGNEVMINDLEEVTRIGIAFQKLIVKRSTGFLLGNGVKFKKVAPEENEKSEKLFSMLEKVWHDNKMQFKDLDIFTYLMSECEVAELWYFDEKEDYWGEVAKSKFVPKLQILAPSDGYQLYPLFDSTGDMVCFSTYYQTKENDKTIEHFDIYTDEETQKWEKREGQWSLPPEKRFKSPGKITIVYHAVKTPDWWDVQSEIERLEYIQSNHGDTNDYNGSPILFFKGEITGFAKKGDRGKTLTGSENADAKYLSWESAPESIKLEIENLRRIIFEMTQTPDISFETVKTLGDVSGIALQLMFADAHMKAWFNWGNYGIGVQRRINIILAMLTEVVEVSLKEALKTLNVSPEVSPFLPVNKKELMDMAVQAKAAGVSQETIYENCPWVKDVSGEIERKKSEQTQNLGESFEL